MAKANLRDFDYQKVGKLDADMWRAYYNHKFFSLFRLLFLLIKQQLHLSWFTTLRLAYYSAWAAADYRINRKNVNRERVLKNITKFYKLVSDNATETFNYRITAKLELEWWDVHRASKENNEELEQSLATAAAAMYNLNPALLKEYANYRAEAMILPRHRGDSDNNKTDWARIEEMTINSWGALHKAVQ